MRSGHAPQGPATRSSTPSTTTGIERESALPQEAAAAALSASVRGWARTMPSFSLSGVRHSSAAWASRM